jgi:2-haloalkanoic acid dehalogenase type II
LSTPELITFDCYGTLIDWNAGIAAALGDEARRQGRRTDDTAILDAYHAAEPRVQAVGYHSYREILTLLEAEIAGALGWDPPAEPGYLAESLPSWRPFADSNRSLRRLAQAGCRLGILSNIDDDLLAGTRAHFEVDFDLLVTAEQLHSYKPAPAHFERALESVDGDKPRLLHLAQSYFHDIRPARDLGIQAVWVNRLAESVPPGGPQPTAEVADLDAAVAWVMDRARGSGSAPPAHRRSS